MKTTNTIRPLSTFQLALILLAIAVFTLLCFSPALKNQFINWDDNAYVFENSSLGKPLPEAVAHFFGPHYYVGNYIPITMIAFALEYHAAGITPYFFHLVNVLLHLANVLLVFWFIYLLSGKKFLVAGLVCFFFALHPMHVESVAWVSELKDVLYTFFFLLALLAYCNYGTQGYQKLTFLFVALLLFVLSALSKPAAVIFPFVLLLVDYYRQRKFDARAWIEKIPFLLVSIVLGVAAIKAQQADHLLMRLDYPLVQRICFASHSLLSYVFKCFLPLNLSIFYPYPQLPGGGLPFSYCASPFVVAGLLYVFYRLLKQSRTAVFGGLFFLVNSVLVLQLIAVGDAVMAERYTYVSYTGLFFSLAMGFQRLYDNRGTWKKYGMIALTAVALAGIACAYATHQRCQVWRNDDTIATDLLNKFPDDRLALNNKGFILMERHRYAEAAPLFIRAIQLKPDYTMAYINLVNTYLSLSDYNTALATVDKALRHIPANEDLLRKKAQVLFMRGDYAGAAEWNKKLLQLKKNDISMYIALAECYYKLMDYAQALSVTEDALKIEPANYILLSNKGYMLFLMKQYSEAIPFFEASLKINPGYKTASINLADCRRMMSGSAR